MESIHAYQDLLSREPKDRDVDWLTDACLSRKDMEMIITLIQWEE